MTPLRSAAPLWIATLGVLCGVNPSAAAQQAVAEPNAARLGFVGDVIPHRMVVELAEERGRDPRGGASASAYGQFLARIAPVIRDHDFAVFNMESPVGWTVYRTEAPKRFLASPALVGAFQQAGFDAAICANNHAMDQGREGVRDTLEHLAAVNLSPLGCGLSAAAAQGPHVFKVGGLRVAFVAFSTELNGNLDRVRSSTDAPQPLLCAGDGSCDEVMRAVKAARALADAVVVSAHWGKEYADRPREADRRIARELVLAGADVIVGHHPHVLVPAEWIPRVDGSRALVIYSVGNFLVEQCGLHPELKLCDRRLATLASLTLTKSNGAFPDVSVSFLPLWIEHSRRCTGEVRAPGRCIEPRLLTEEGSLERWRYDVVKRFMGPFSGSGEFMRFDDVVHAVTARRDLGTHIVE